MTTERKLVIALVAVAVMIAAAIPFVLRYQANQQVRKAIVAYDMALVDALRTLNTAPLAGTVTWREESRVGSYIQSLYGRGVSVEGTLLDFDLESVQSGDPTITATVRERWSYIERDTKTGKQIGKPIEEENRLKYTLLPEANVLVVHLSEFVTDEKPLGTVPTAEDDKKSK